MSYTLRTSDVRELRGSTTARKGRGFQKKSGIVGAAKGAAAQDDDSAMEVDHSGYDTYGEGAEGKYQRCMLCGTKRVRVHMRVIIV